MKNKAETEKEFRERLKQIYALGKKHRRKLDERNAFTWTSVNKKLQDGYNTSEDYFWQSISEIVDEYEERIGKMQSEIKEWIERSPVIEESELEETRAMRFSKVFKDSLTNKQ